MSHLSKTLFSCLDIKTFEQWYVAFASIVINKIYGCPGFDSILCTGNMNYDRNGNKF